MSRLREKVLRGSQPRNLLMGSLRRRRAKARVSLSLAVHSSHLAFIIVCQEKKLKQSQVRVAGERREKARVV